MESASQRVRILDAFRCIAILSVIAYHYLYRFSPPYAEKNYYPYEYEPSILQYGFFGVQLFFVISGFVIFKTLEKSGSFKEFAIKRMIRLWPTMVLCSIITALIINKYNHFSILNFLPSWTFTPPELWNAILNCTEIGYVDSVYWSLFVEVIFYVVGGLIFFFQPTSFLSNWLRITLLITVFRIISSPRNQFLFSDDINSIFSGIYNLYLQFHFSYWIYFSLGIFFYYLYSQNKPSLFDIAMMLILVLLEFYFLKDQTLRILFIAVILLFSILVYNEKWLSFFKFKVFSWIGLVSYPLYLLHQSIGIILINKISDATNKLGNIYLPFIVTLAMLVISGLIYTFFEKPVMLFMKVRLKNYLAKE